MRDAAVYVRISRDGDGEGLGVKRQEEDGRALAKRKGWNVGQVYRDNDISAVKYRPEWEQMLRDIADGRVGAVIAYSSSRLYRDVDGDKARLFAACMQQDQNGDRVQIETVVSGTIDPYTADGRMLANILASVDAAERERTGERLRRMMQGKRDKGEWVGRVPFGFRIDGSKHLEPDPDEQAILRDAADRYVAGESFNAIARSLGMATSVLSKILHSERVLAELPDDLSGPLAQALVERQAQRVPNNRTSLLGGIARCSMCGKGLTLAASRGDSRGEWYGSYRCPVRWHVGIVAGWLDAYVTEQVLDYIDVDILVASRERKAKRTRKVSDLEARIDHLNSRYIDGKVRPADYDRMSEALLGQLKEAERIERENGGVDLPAELARNLSKTWPTFATSTQRQIIRAVVKSLTVTKATSHGPITDDRVEIRWRS